MDTPQPTPSFDESIKQVMQTLPPPIRNYIAQEKYTAVARSLMVKYGLHIDQGAVVEREIMLLLMGVENPDEFVLALSSEASLDQKTVDNIVRDVNEQVFMPLREEMRISSAPASAKPSVPQPPRPQPQFQQPRPQTAPPLPPRRPVSNPNIAPLPPKNILPHRLLENHEEPHIYISNKVQDTKKPSYVPPNLPGVIYHPPLPRSPSQPNATPTSSQGIAPLPPRPTPRPIPVVAVAPPAPAKPYSTDPYREPIES